MIPLMPAPRTKTSVFLHFEGGEGVEVRGWTGVALIYGQFARRRTAPMIVLRMTKERRKEQ